MSESAAKVLVADDSRAIATALALSLRRNGFNVTTTHSGEEALRATGDCQFDLVISDQQMLGVSGDELCRRLRSRNEYRETPFVLLTASSELDAARLIEESGVTCVVSKPFHPSEVVDLAKSFTRQRL
jgi:two-component system phosphate regulon response regulator PhoB